MAYRSIWTMVVWPINQYHIATRTKIVFFRVGIFSQFLDLILVQVIKYLNSLGCPPAYVFERPPVIIVQVFF